MSPRRKPIPSPIARATDVRPLAPVRSRSVLPTVAALLALGALGCENGSESITRDSVMAATIAQVAPAPIATNESDPLKPLPGMAALEDPPPQPVPTTHPTVVTPPKHPYPVKGGLKAVHPVPTAAIPMPGGPKIVSPPPPIAPTPKAPKLGGDMPAVETT